MSVVFQSSSGWVLDSLSLINRGYQQCIRWADSDKSHVKCCFKWRCFQILKSRYNLSGESMNQTRQLVGKKKQMVAFRGFLPKYSQCATKQIRSVILEGTKLLVDSARSLGYLTGETDTVEEPLPSQECSLAALCEMAKELPLVEDEEQKECIQLLATEDGCAAHVDLFSQVTENKEDWAAVVTMMGEEYVIPPNTAFLLSDFTRIQPLVQCKKFDLIVIDPPWENKSVKRSRRYSFLPSTQLKRLPVPQLSSSGCLLVTWVTNRPSHLRFVRDELYPHWGVQVVAEWFWLKVTTSGQFVFPLDSQHKKPYEVLILGRCPTNTSTRSSERPEIEDKRLIVSVPSALHSQKPSLSEVLKPYVGAEAKCLELFARSLQPGWTSWGNEVLKFQHVSYFNVTPDDRDELLSLRHTSHHD
uniref:Methyltransferase 4, N6-adenosine n=1 Tax=Kryptolebias marmoratus TaxID=37003 RepID=A0A3Q3AS12_KRYMA